MGRDFYNWTVIPYAMYALSGVIIAYMYFNRKQGIIRFRFTDTAVWREGDEGLLESAG